MTELAPPAAVGDTVADWPVERRAELCAGADTWHTSAVPELGLPALRVSDGPNGVRGHVYDGEASVCFPCGSALAATWNVDLITEVGRALAAESRRKGVAVLLAPTVNLHRHPLAGRNFEAFSEDPHLTARLAVAYISGLQESGVAACVKHFAGNEQEYQRHTMSSEIDERTLREVYLRPFEAAVREAGTWWVMASYNRLNGIPVSDHEWLLTTVLRDEWGFTGAVMSDWNGTRSTAAAVRAGVDLEMPGPTRWRGERLVAAVQSGSLGDDDLSAAAKRVVAAIDQANRSAATAPSTDVDVTAIAMAAATEAMVLLRNDGVLPLATGSSVAIIGANAEPGQIQGGGSARMNPDEQVSPLAGISGHPAAGAVSYELGGRIAKYCEPLTQERLSFDSTPGAQLELFTGLGCDGDPIAVRRVRSLTQHFYGDVDGIVDPRCFSARLTATYRPDVDGPHRLGLACAGTATVLVDGEPVVAASAADGVGTTMYGWGTDEAVGDVELVAGTAVTIVVEFDRDTDSPLSGTMVGLTPPDPDDLIERAAASAAGADVAVVVVGLDGQWETEGADRQSLELPGRQNELVCAVAAANRRTVVVVNSGSPVTMPWVDEVAAIVHASYPGQAFGSGLAAVLFGDANPSGKLPTTWPRAIEDCPAHGNFPGSDGQVFYREGLHLGHRHFDRAGIDPLFPFGHGLSYTTFGYASPTIARSPRSGAAVIAVPVTNTGDRRGVEIVQFYAAHPDSAIDRPVRQLVGFARVEVDPGDTVNAEITLAPTDLAYWDVAAARWAVEPGEVRVSVGASSRDLRAAVGLAIDVDEAGTPTISADTAAEPVTSQSQGATP